METVVNSKGQILIPSTIRKQLGIKDGTYLQIDVDAVRRQIILTPVTGEHVHSLRGKYKGKGLMKALMAEKKHVGELQGSLKGKGALKILIEERRKG
jgi:AbrB family looped-hinge helix DNA binding protein